jgi:predicted transcriptional regulator
MAERVAKITISIPTELLGDIDGLAAETGETRSFVLREAASQYLATKRDLDAAAARRRGVARAQEVMREIRSMPVLDDRPSLEILRELRENDGFLERPTHAGKETDEADE